MAYPFLSIQAKLQFRRSFKTWRVKPKHMLMRLCQNPFRAPLDVLVDKHADIAKHKAADVEAKELGRVSRAELETNVCWRRVPETWIFDLSCDLIWQIG